MAFFSFAKPSGNNVLQPLALRVGSGCNILLPLGLANVNARERMFNPLIMAGTESINGPDLVICITHCDGYKLRTSLS